MRVLVTGGAGYIGAHTVDALLARGDEVVVVDDLVTGDPRRVPGVPLLTIDLAEPSSVALLGQALREHRVDAVIHFAARKQVGESVARPAWYYQQNVGGLSNLLSAMSDAGVGTLVFSSSAAVYGNASGAVDESTPTVPISPYGETKLVGEWLIGDVSRASGLRAASLRYFNVAGAARPELGDTEALNLVPIVFEHLDNGRAPVVFGDDYPTADGTCIRDYVHVVDVAEAHLAALDTIAGREPGHLILNIGTGTGTSVLEMLAQIATASGLPTTPRIEARRPGDAANLIAEVSRARDETGWRARFELPAIVDSAWASHLAGRRA